MQIKTRRIKAGLSQIALADLLGVNQTAISQWETGYSLPSADKLPRLAQALGCSIDALFEEAEDAEAAAKEKQKADKENDIYA